MEEIREEKVSQILSWLQAAARGKMSRKTYKKLQQQKVKTHAWNSNSNLLTNGNLSTGEGCKMMRNRF